MNAGLKKEDLKISMMYPGGVAVVFSSSLRTKKRELDAEFLDESRLDQHGALRRHAEARARALPQTRGAAGALADLPFHA